MLGDSKPHETCSVTVMLLHSMVLFYVPVPQRTEDATQPPFVSTKQCHDSPAFLCSSVPVFFMAQPDICVIADIASLIC